VQRAVVFSATVQVAFANKQVAFHPGEAHRTDRKATGTADLKLPCGTSFTSSQNRKERLAACTRLSFRFADALS